MILSGGKNYAGDIYRSSFSMKWGKVVESGRSKKVGKGLSPFQSTTDILTNPNILPPIYPHPRKSYPHRHSVRWVYEKSYPQF